MFNKFIFLSIMMFTSVFFWQSCTATGTDASAKMVDKHWICYYGDKDLSGPLSKVDLVVLDAETKVPLAALKEKGVHVLGYLSIGEVNIKQPYYKDLQETTFQIKPNPVWDGAYYVDIRSEYWQNYLLDKRVPQLLEKGFDGLFLDTLDSIVELAQEDQVKYVGMTAAMVSFLAKLQERYPQLYTMANRGIEAAPDYGGFVNSILAESMTTDYNFKTKKYRVRKVEEAAAYHAILAQVKSKYNISIYSLDYWSKEDKQTIAAIYAANRKKGYLPYVASIALNEIYPVY